MAFVDPSAGPEDSLDFQKDWKTFLNDEGEGAELEREALKGEGPPRRCSAGRTAGILAGSARGDARRLLGPSHGGARDGSASSSVPEEVYEVALGRGISVVTPNKSFAAGPASVYEGALAAAARWVPPSDAAAGGPPPPRPLYLGEATVGAGLPVISTLRDLLATGDRVKKIEGVFSGSLSFIFNTLFVGGGGGVAQQQSSPPLSLASVVRRAKELGYTEPDPRDDLAGVDVARKAVILARAPPLQGRCRTEEAADPLLPLSSSSPTFPSAPWSPRTSLTAPRSTSRPFLNGLESDDGGVGEEIAKAKSKGKF